MLGLHGQLATPEAMEYLYRAQPGLVKWMDWGRTYLLRQYCNWYKNKYGIKPTVIARDYDICFLDVGATVEKIKHLQQLAGDVIDYYELTNELACTGAAALRELNSFSLEVMRALPGVKFLLGSIAEGNPPIIEDIVELVPALRVAKTNGGGLALHEYSQPTMLTEATWHCGRFIRIIDALPDDLKDIIIYVTECGIDGGAVVQMFPVRFGRGWRTYTTEVPYLNQLRWYNALMEANRIKGGTIFNVGSEERWKDFELIGANLIADYIASQQVIVAPVPKRLYLAICPSNQNNNIYMATTEQAQLALYAARMLAVCRTIPNVVAKVFTGMPESKDTYYLQGLYNQLDAARLWLQAQPEPSVKVCFNLHSDSGTFGHIGYYWWNQGHSRMLGELIANKLQSLYYQNETILNQDYSNYAFVRLTKSVCTPLLLEMGSHQNSHDISVLRDMGYLVARTTVMTTLDYFKDYLT